MSAVAIGVDAGSTTFKAVAIAAGGELVASRVSPTNPRIQLQVAEELAALRDAADLAGDVPIGATGYGRKRVGADRVLTEITCHARGAFHRTRRSGVLIDMGGQDTKVIRVGPRGRVLDFAMNDKCAAGTGRFLEVLLRRLQVGYDAVYGLVQRADRTVSVSSTCTVFAESEIISLVAEGASVEGILKGVHASLAARVSALAGVLPGGEPIFMSGGVALNRAMVDALAEAVGREVAVLPDPQLVGAVGAALAVL